MRGMRGLKIFALMILATGIGVMTYAGQQLLETNRMFREGNSVYDELNTYAKTRTTGTMESVSYTLPEDLDVEPQTDAIENIIDFKVLELINSDAAAWLYSPGTVIDYPVMRADDYSYYLNHLPNGTVNANGSLFIDYNHEPDFSGRMTVIYGHHMKSGAMFGSLVGYKEQKYYDEHPYMLLYTAQGSYRADILYGFVIDAGQWSEQAFMYEENFDELLRYAAQNTTFKSETAYNKDDRFLVLSTCSYEFDDARYAIIATLTQLT